MSKRVILLLTGIAVFSSLATVVVMSVAKRNTTVASPSAPKSSSSPAKKSIISATAPYAYATSSDFVVMRGDREIARVKRKFDNLDDPLNNQVAWTSDGAYVVFMSQEYEPSSPDTTPVRPTDPANMHLDAVNATSGAVSSFPCPDCVTFAAVGDDSVVVLARLDQQDYQMRRFDLAASKPMSAVDMSGLQHPDASMSMFVAGLDGKVLVEYDGANSDIVDGIYFMNADGSSGTYWNGLPGQGKVLFSAAAERTIYGLPEIAVAASGWQSACGASDNIILISPSGNEVDTRMDTVGPSPADADTVDDLWWGADGHLYATMSARTCPGAADNTSASLPDSLYRLDDSGWVQEDPGPVTMVRTFPAGAKVVLTEQDCSIDQSVPPNYCNTGPLYLEQAGKQELVADHVILVSSPPPAAKSAT